MTRLTSFALATVLVASTAACRKPPAAQAASDTESAQTPAKPAAPEPIKPMPAQLPDVLARVNGENVTRGEFDRLVKNMELSAGQPIPAERRDEILRRALDQLVTYTVLTQETRARNVTVPPAEVDSNISDLRKRFPNEEEFKKALDQRGMTVERLRADAQVDLAINKMMEAEVASAGEATDAQVREFYDKNPDEFTQVRASHILIKPDDKGGASAAEKAKTRTESVLKQAKGGADFAELAKKHSADDSAKQGGDLGFFSKGQMVGPFSDAAFALKPGEISGIVETPFGFHIIKVAERKVAPYEQVSARIREHLTDQNKQERAQSFIESLKKKARIEVLI